VARPQEIPIQTTDSPQYVLVVGRLAGGRRLLSDDAAMLDRTAVLIARRIDALRLTDERYERMLQEREMRNLATEAELRALRSQINPHFLFNALTTIGYLIDSAPPRALETLLRLTTLLRSVLRSEGEFTTLGHERELIECYLQIEHERFEERLLVRIDIPQELHDIPIPALIVQPLVENAIKHGVASARDGGNVLVKARLTDAGTGSTLCIAVRNTGAPMRGRTSTSGGGVGLRNVERRLACYYGEAARLELRTEPDGATVAELRLPTREADDENARMVPRARPA
jgi:LytS/YehU family sensor histidine kinase